MVNVFLDYRVDEAGNIAVVINIFTDLRGADILQLLRELQLHDFSGDLLVNLRRVCLTRRRKTMWLKEWMEFSSGSFL